MEYIHSLLKKEGYYKIRFTVSKTQHLLIKSSINGVKGIFILDTGASNSCLGNEGVGKFGLITKDSATKASGAGGRGMFTQTSHHNTLSVGRWKTSSFNIVVLDLSHVNEALNEYKTSRVDGIIGADILLVGSAFIDYGSRYLFLKKIRKP